MAGILGASNNFINFENHEEGKPKGLYNSYNVYTCCRCSLSIFFFRILPSIQSGSRVIFCRNCKTFGENHQTAGKLILPKLRKKSNKFFLFFFNRLQRPIDLFSVVGEILLLMTVIILVAFQFREIHKEEEQK